MTPGETIIIAGTNFGGVPGAIYYCISTGLSVGLASSNLGASEWLDFTHYCTISSWNDNSIELTLDNVVYGQYNSASFQISMATANTSTTTSVWSNSLFLQIVGPDPFPVIDSICDANNNPLPGNPQQAIVNTYVIINGTNFGATPGKVEWYLPIPPGSTPPLGSFNAWGTLYFTSSVLQLEWTNSQIAALTPPTFPYAQGATGRKPTLLVRVIDSQGNPSNSITSGTSVYSNDAYPILLVPPPVYVYVVNAGDNSLSVIDASALKVIDTIQLVPTNTPLPKETVTTPTLDGTIIEPITVPLGIATNTAGTKSLCHSPDLVSNPSAAWTGRLSYKLGGVSGWVPSQGYVAVIQTDPLQDNWNTVLGYYPVGTNPQSLAVITPSNVNSTLFSNPYEDLIYVSNAGSLAVPPNEACP